VWIKIILSVSADDCFRLGAVAYFNQDYYHTVMWITEALNIWQTEQPKTIDKATLLDYLSYSLYMVSFTPGVFLELGERREGQFPVFVNRRAGKSLKYGTW